MIELTNCGSPDKKVFACIKDDIDTIERAVSGKTPFGKDVQECKERLAGVGITFTIEPNPNYIDFYEPIPIEML